MSHSICRLAWLSLLLAITASSVVHADPQTDTAKPDSFLERSESGVSILRMMSWNIWKGSIFPPDGIRHESFKRIVATVRPDVICLQEAAGPQVETLPSLMDTLIPLEEDEKWHIHYAPNSDNVVLSRYPLMHCSQEDVIALPFIAPGFHLGFIGCIIDEAEFGPDISLDWEGSYMAEVKPRHNGDGKDWYTWRSDQEPFAPGALDRIIYTDSVLEAEHSFVLNTTTMKDEELSRHGLLSTDVLRRSKHGDFDHLPLVVDFSTRSEEIAKLRQPSKRSE